MKPKNTLKITLIILIAVNVLLVSFFVTLVFVDPANCFRGVNYANGTYKAEEAELEEVDFFVESINISLYGENQITINDAGEKKILDTKILIGGDQTIVNFNYESVNYYVRCRHKSDDFKLFDKVDCDYLECEVQFRGETEFKTIGRFQCRKVA